MFQRVVRGNVVTPRGVLLGGYVGVSNGKIAYLGADDPGAADTREDHDGALLFPGAIDAQVHSRSQKGREGVTRATMAAAAGGITTIIEMPFDEGLLVCSADAVGQKAADVAAQAHVDVGIYGTINPGEGVARIPEMVRAGVCGFKFSTFGTDPVRFPRIPPQLMAEAFAAVARTGLTAGVHNENDEIVRAAAAAVKAEGRTDYLAHGRAHTRLSELLAMAEIYEIGAFTGCPAHVVHCSQGRGVDICSSYKAQGFASTVEVCIHYLLFSEDTTVREKAGLAKVNPPIRPREETEKLWHHLAAGAVDLVSTDHVAWSLDRKNNPNMLANASGGPSLEALVPSLVKGCLDRGIDLSVAARVLAHNPARHFRLSGTKGAFAIGTDADFSVVDPTLAPWSVAKSQTVSDWSLYDGMMLPQVAETYLRGEPIWNGASVLNGPGSGVHQRPFAA